MYCITTKYHQNLNILLYKQETQLIQCVILWLKKSPHCKLKLFIGSTEFLVDNIILNIQNGMILLRIHCFVFDLKKSKMQV